MIAIVDYGLGNLASIKNMISRIGYDSVITSSENEISKATKLILPGVGAFDQGIKNIQELGLKEILDIQVLYKKIPILGICLGMQLMTKSSEEGELLGLSWVSGCTKKFEFNDSILKIPHMGWNEVQYSRDNVLTKDFIDHSRFYFVHSYYVDCEKNEDILFESEYGVRFVSGFNHDNIYGVQFHPEKSHKYGMLLLKNFIELC
jgi:glutamine amidotransferase